MKGYVVDLDAALIQVGYALTHPDANQSVRDFAYEDVASVLAELRASRRVVEAAEEVRYEMARMTGLGEVPQLKQVAWWRDRLQKALGERSLLNVKEDS